MMDPTQMRRCDNDWTVSRVLTISVAILCLVSVILRFWTKFIISKRIPGGDRRFLFTEWTMLTGYICSVAITCLDVYLATDKNPTKPDDIHDIKVGEFNFSIHIGWLTAMWTISSSALFYYECIFKDVIMKWEKAVLSTLQWLVLFWWLTSVLFVVFQNGIHFDVYWKLGPNTSYQVRIWYTNVVHIILDVMIIALPIIWVWRSQPGWSSKFIYLLLFLAYASTTGLSIWRLLLLNKRFNASAEDRYELSIKAVMCSVIEANLAIFCANIPTLGYQLFLSWFRTHKYGDFSGESRRVMTIGSGQKLNNRPEYWELDENVAERHWRPRSRNIDF